MRIALHHSARQKCRAPDDQRVDTLTRAREQMDWSASISPKAKFKVIPTAIGSFGFALAVSQGQAKDEDR